ncbi:alpha/beta hydrolase [Bacillus atrophaeus]|nr:alpha/beta hydrolase [Bacillus atrophaeus]MCY8918562.1 alpha/beta hydrolase [Bacillus atrophaeus]
MKKKFTITLVLTVISSGLLLSAITFASKTSVDVASKASVDTVSKTPVAYKPDLSNGADNFYKSNKVNKKNVSFKNQYNMKVAGNLFIHKGLNQNTKNPAIIVGHPMGAVKEQSANLYAQKMAEKGFVTLSLDLSFWGESEGQPRNAVSLDICRGFQCCGGFPRHPAVC